MDFITLDFETATHERNSACEIGLTIVENGAIKKVIEFLIKPPQYPDFDPFIMSIHGIEPEHVKDAPTFDQIWPQIKAVIQDKLIIAHNASFDMSVLRNTLDTYEIEYPQFEYLCSYQFSKNIWKDALAYDLMTLCLSNNIEFKHHRAGSDSEATAKLCIKAFEEFNVNDVNDIQTGLKVTTGTMGDQDYSRGYCPSRSLISAKAKPKEIVGDPSKHNPDSIFYHSNVVLTGTLSSMTRIMATQALLDIGANVLKRVTKKTDYLIVGQQDFRIVGEDGMSLKQEKAMAMRGKGHHIEVISEKEFLRNI